MRNTFIDELIKLARINNKIILMVGDLGFSVVEAFREEFPDRFINAGVAEQNMMGVAAGLASEGCHVFVYSIANFPTFRCAEQIRNDIDHHNLPVTIVSVGGGLVYGNLGYSHHAVQDYALIRSFPNMLIAAPGDSMETRACLRYLVNNPQPSYLRLGKVESESIHPAIPEIMPGEWLPVLTKKSLKKIFLTTGGVLEFAYNSMVRDGLGEGCSLYSVPLWSMKTKVQQVINVSRYCQVTTLEDHLEDGGFGSWMLEALSSSPEIIGRMRIKGLNPAVTGVVAKQATLNMVGGLSRDIFEF